MIPSDRVTPAALLEGRFRAALEGAFKAEFDRAVALGAFKVALERADDDCGGQLSRFIADDSDLPRLERLLRFREGAHRSGSGESPAAEPPDFVHYQVHHSRYRVRDRKTGEFFPVVWADRPTGACLTVDQRTGEKTALVLGPGRLEFIPKETS